MYLNIFSLALIATMTLPMLISSKPVGEAVVDDFAANNETPFTTFTESEFNSYVNPVRKPADGKTTSNARSDDPRLSRRQKEEYPQQGNEESIGGKRHGKGRGRRGQGKGKENGKRKGKGNGKGKGKRK